MAQDQTLPEGIAPRGLPKACAMLYCGFEPGSRKFAKLVSDGLLPAPLPGTEIWDRKALDKALDKLGGLDNDDEREGWSYED
ncbi:MAG: hypothetical protein AAF495_10740 [Pseudomonadota bacterium]